MAYQRSTLISRAGYSGLGADPYVNKDIIDAYRSVRSIGDVSPVGSLPMLAAAGAAVWFLFLRKKRR
jgi:hypothetical protein